ncbi:chemotaxis protein CheA [Geomonas sp. RF6]|uniref:chemotaxis protein CheA n=1 Tax=Geomonas sp. RF6 TaxID=2897342 RepID=UPI001E3266CD|nr:chemotaxis protein CheA [Geomonas sp. RF6]UFS72557.1 chemotaxis protein CheA [Geomonas sp. RF6]
MKDVHAQAYREEAYELLSELESSLLELEENPEDIELVGRVFRAMHTIKGSGAMFGFDEIAAFTHEVETVFDRVRNGEMKVTKTLVTLTLDARDQIRVMLDATGPVDLHRSGAIIAGLRGLCEGKGGAAPGAPAKGAAKEAPAVEATYRIRFAPAPEIFSRGTNPVHLLNELRELGRCTVFAQSTAVPLLGEIDAESCHLFWDVVLTTDRGLEAIEEVFIFVEDDCTLKIDLIDDGAGDPEEGNHKMLGEILVERGDLSLDEMKSVLASRKLLGEILVEKGLVSPETIASALAEQQHVKEVQKERQSQEGSASIRVPAHKLDLLVNLVGELVTVQARLSQTTAGRKDPEMKSIAEEVERLTAELRDNVLNIRMLPIGSTFSKFKRLVRDLSQELGKEIEMTTEGAETELDKTVIEKLNDPLVHLIRNSIDHGIEAPEARAAAGKPRQGKVHLAARHSGDSVVITIADDGAGLDRERIRGKAVEKGLISPTAELSDREIFAQIFAPGFSTAQKVTSVSGRGVGMDVVKRAIDALRGTIEISSVRGRGATISVRIPLTLAIIETLLVKIGSDRFLIPLSLVDEVVFLTRDQVEKSHGRNLVPVRGQLIPYLPLRQRFNVAGKRPDFEQVVITRVGETTVGVVVDHVIGEHQTVIKSLGHAYKDLEGVSGATILGDGAVALILDIPQLVRQVELEGQ